MFRRIAVACKAYWFGMLVILPGFCPQLIHAQATIEIFNPSSIERAEEVISIPWKQVVSAYPTVDTATLTVYDPVLRRAVPHQLECLGKNEIMNLLLQVSVPPKSKISLQLKKAKHASYPAKTYCRYVPERKDDFAWENDKIAFRAYGKALENTIENAYGIDVWVKRTSDLVINKRYKLNDYHSDHGDGLDYYHVGLTLGAGNNAPYGNDSIWYAGNYQRWEILDNGPLRSTFKLEYDTWKVNNLPVRLTLTMSIDAGNQLHKVEALYSFAGADSLPVAVGIIKRPKPGVVFLDEQQGMMGYWEPADAKNGTTGVGCIFPQRVKNMTMAKEQILSLSAVRSGNPLIYYRGAAWDKAGDITNAKQWFGYLQQFSERIKYPLQITVRAAD